MEEVYRNIVGIEEALRLQESSSLELARENLRLVNHSITLYTGLLREIDSLGFLPTQLEELLSR